MATDNTILNAGLGGDTVRTLAKTINAPAKTQVMALDVGGGDASAESLLAVGTAKMAASIPVTIASDDTLTAQILAQQIPIQGVVPLTVGTAAAAGRGLRIICTTAGNVAIQFVNGSTDTIPVSVGLTILNFAVTEILSSGTTATATYANLV